MIITQRTTSSGFLVIDLSGSVDMYHSVYLRDTVLESVEKSVDSVFINLKDVTYIDSSGVAALVFTSLSMKKKGKKLELLNPSENVMNVLGLLRLDSFFVIHNQTEDFI